MAAVTICSDFGAPQNKICHCFHCFLIYLPWSGGIGCHDLSSSYVEFSTSFFHSPFSLSTRGSSVPLHSIRRESSAYLRLLIFLLAVLILACASSSLACLMMYSAYKLNEQGDNIQPWCTPFPIWNQSVVPVLTVVSWAAYRFLRRQVRWSGIPIALRTFHSLLWSTQSKAYGIVSTGEVNVFLEFSCFFLWSSGCWQFDFCLLCLLSIQLEALEVLDSQTVETWLGEFWALLY